MRVRRVTTTRAGGRSSGPFARFNLSRGVGDDPVAVAGNRFRLRRELGLDGVVFLQQVHGTAVEVVGTVPGSTDAPDVPDRDAVVTTTPGLGVAVLAADCVPILLSDPDARVVGAAHAGRVGAAGGVLRTTVDTMTGLGARVDRLEVLLGPAICGSCYEVPATMRDEVEAALPGSATRTRSGTPALDLRAGLTAQLTELGIRKVASDPRCTREDPDLFSHRRDGRTGRHAAVIWLDPHRT